MAKEQRALSEEFLYLLYNSAFRKGYICGIVVENMRNDYLPDKQFQLINKVISVYYKAYKSAPSYGFVTEKINEDFDAVELLQTIKEFEYNDPEEVIISTFEEYIKDVKLKQLYAKIPQYYNKGQADKAQEEIKQYAEWLNSFSLHASKFVNVIDTFGERYNENVKAVEESRRMSKRTINRFYIDDLDEMNGGRSLRGQLSCFLASTGIGKSHIARHIGTHAAIDDGLNVLHFQLEGSEKEVVDAYSGCLVERSSYCYERGKFSAKEMEAFQKKLSQLSGNIDVRSFPKFNNKVSTVDIKNGIEEYKKIYGESPDLIIIDSMDLLTDSSGKNYDNDHERHKRIAVANDLKDLASDEDVWIVVTYQATIENKDWRNDEKNVLTEYNCAEAKGLGRPLTHLISLNQSDNEAKEQTMRLHVAKSRFFKKGATVKIATRYEDEVFYDRQRTLNMSKCA
jgi:replicative DNA helicase